MKLILPIIVLVMLSGCTNCYNHINSDNRIKGATTGSGKVIVPPAKVSYQAPKATEEWTLTSTTREVVGSYLVLQ